MASRQVGQGYKSVRYRARVKANGKERYLGTFNTQEEAEQAERKFREERAPKDFYHVTQEKWYERDTTTGYYRSRAS